MENKQNLVKLCVDSVMNPTQVQHFAKGADVDATIRSQFFNLMGTEKPTMKDIRKHKVAIFEILEEVLTETYKKGIIEDEFFMQFAEIRNIALGDAQEFYLEDDAVLVVSEHAGSHWSISRQKLEGGTSFTVKTKAYAIGVYGDFFLFATGRLSFAKLVSKVAEAIQNKIYEEVAMSFANAVTKLPAEFTATGSYDEAKLQEIVAHVEAVTGSPAIVVGTRQALAKVTAGLNVVYYSDAMKNELNKTGRIANVNGLTLVQLPNVHKQNTFEFAYDDNQLLILPQTNDRFVKIVFEGEDYMKEVSDELGNVDMSLEYKFITRFGVHSIFSTLFGVYTLA
ncbi:hypothetical protein ACIQ1D_19435 [Lysinibacillus xylanilyticus]|uniref:hypothetical protein n=1 Tax=Lysinibacillus xylanilyticus TaxID=582475 RepID=UPI00381C9CF9